MPFSRARVEEPVKGNRKRHDLRIYDRADKVILTGEVKRPENPDGRSPYQESLVMDAPDKAKRCRRRALLYLEHQQVCAAEDV